MNNDRSIDGQLWRLGTRHEGYSDSTIASYHKGYGVYLYIGTLLDHHTSEGDLCGPNRKAIDPLAKLHLPRGSSLVSLFHLPTARREAFRYAAKKIK